VVLPECLDLGWTHPSARDLAQPIPGPHCAQLTQAVKNAGVYVAAGLVERAGPKLFNAAVLIGPSGDLLLHHRKINELDIALDLYSVGDRVGVVDTELGHAGAGGLRPQLRQLAGHRPRPGPHGRTGPKGGDAEGVFVMTSAD